MGLFKSGKGFKFNMGMDDDFIDDIGFDENNIVHNNRTKSNNEKCDG